MNYKVTTFILLLHLLAFITPDIIAQNIDIEILNRINHSNQSMMPLSQFADKWAVPISAGIPVVMGGMALLGKDKDLLRDALYVGVSMGVNAGIVSALKLGIQRPRPFVTYPDMINKYGDGGSYSFPSGHSSTVFALATSLSLKYKKWYVVAPSYLFAGYVGYSRMHVGVHYPSDVIAGALLGAGSAWLTYEVEKLILNKR